MRKLSIIAMLFISSMVFAQTNESDTETSETEYVEDNSDNVQDAEFPGGNDALYDYIAKNVKYPDKYKSQGVDGEVTVEFTVGIDGSLSNFNVLDGINDDLDKEAIRVVKSMPKWTPAKENGEPIESTVEVGVGFWEE